MAPPKLSHQNSAQRGIHSSACFPFFSSFVEKVRLIFFSLFWEFDINVALQNRSRYASLHFVCFSVTIVHSSRYTYAAYYFRAQTILTGLVEMQPQQPQLGGMYERVLALVVYLYQQYKCMHLAYVVRGAPSLSLARMPQRNEYKKGKSEEKPG